jgi:hypothetical protein
LALKIEIKEKYKMQLILRAKHGDSQLNQLKNVA